MNARVIPIYPVAALSPANTQLARLGLFLRRHRTAIVAVQWAVVVVYVFLVTVPAFLSLPAEEAHILTNLTRFAQFAFWGVWWPGVILATALLGRVWCGYFCPEGTISEAASRVGLNRPIPAWLKWRGWPFVAFLATTIYGQLVSVYEYPKAALLVLGGSTVAAVAVGLLWGRGHRVWCKHLCPANGVFRILARLAPVHFRVDQAAWTRSKTVPQPIHCAPMVHIKAMTGGADCHMCGGCAGHKDAIQLAARSPSDEIGRLTDKEANGWEAATILFGMLGVATGAFQWSASPWLVAVKQVLAGWLADRDLFWPLDDGAPWWLLTHYPEVNDTFTWLDGGLVLAYIAVYALVLGGSAWLGLAAAGRLLGETGAWRRLAYGLTPLAGMSVFVGLSFLTTGQLGAEGWRPHWPDDVRMVLLLLATLWSAWLIGRLAGIDRNLSGRKLLAVGLSVAGVMPVLAAWAAMFYLW
jgi:polyferredoxin